MSSELNSKFHSQQDPKREEGLPAIRTAKEQLRPEEIARHQHKYHSLKQQRDSIAPLTKGGAGALEGKGENPLSALRKNYYQKSMEDYRFKMQFLGSRKHLAFHK